MKILIELEVDQEAYDRKYGPGTEWWAKYKELGEKYDFDPVRAWDNWDKFLKDILTEGLYDWTQLHEEALKINVTFP